MRKIAFLISLSVIMASASLLILGSSLLEIAIGNSFPMGTLITWVGLIALPLSIYFGIRKIRYPENKKFRIYRLVFAIIFLLNLLWGFLARWLAGNWAFNFGHSPTFQGSPAASSVFWMMTYLFITFPLLYLLVYLIDVKVIQRNKS